MRYIINCDPRLQIEKPYETLAAPEIVYFLGEINEESAAAFRRDLEVCEHNALVSGQEILPVCLDTPGGCLYSLMGMVDAMQSCSVRIATIAESKVMSAGVALFTCGDKNHRYVGKHATILLHLASGGLSGSVEEVENNTKELRRLNVIADEIMARNCGKKKNFFTSAIKKNGPEWYLTAKEAKELGIASHIGIPSLVTTISYKIEFKL